MNVLLIGSGGRENAIALALYKSKSLTKMFAAPANPGILQYAEYASLDIKDFDAIATFCKANEIDLVMVGPEQPLADGITDALNTHDIKVFGPNSYAAQLESSKAFAKDFMQKYNIPTAKFKTFAKSQEDEALAYIDTFDGKVVLKASGLAAGKGVIIPETPSEAKEAIKEMFGGMFGSAGDNVVIEEFMEGEEASIFAICDGNDFVLLSPSQDHKRIYDNDEGANTGGMGAYCPAKIASENVLEITREQIIKPVLEGLKAEGSKFVGCLFVGLMIKDDFPKVVEFNVRFGDPETQSVLSVLEGDFAKLLFSAASGNIDKNAVSIAPDMAACTVVLASDGYPASYKQGFEITGIADAQNENLIVYHSGTKTREGKLLSAGGRVLAVTGIANNLTLAIENAYAAANLIQFENKYMRKDIGKKGI